MSVTIPEISVIIPVYNRGELVRRTLESVRQSSAGINVEIVVVDDGSTPPLADDLRRLGLTVDQLIRQPNQELLFARLAGLRAARGELILFLDSDDLISREKLKLHVEAMRDGDYDVTYSDHAYLRTDPNGEPLDEPDHPSSFPEASTAHELFLRLGLPPHSPVFRTKYLRGILDSPYFSPSKLFNPVAEIWYYHHCAAQPVKAKHIPGPHALVCQHAAGRITDHWEVLCLASLCVMERFVADTPTGSNRQAARAHVAANALSAWRAHPLGMPNDLEQRFISVWKQAGDRGIAPVGTRSFQYLSRAIGTLAAARLLRRWRNQPYNAIRTVTADQLRELITAYPAPGSASS